MMTRRDLDYLFATELALKDALLDHEDSETLFRTQQLVGAIVKQGVANPNHPDMSAALSRLALAAREASDDPTIDPILKDRLATLARRVARIVVTTDPTP